MKKIVSLFSTTFNTKCIFIGLFFLNISGIAQTGPFTASWAFTSDLTAVVSGANSGTVLASNAFYTATTPSVTGLFSEGTTLLPAPTTISGGFINGTGIYGTGSKYCSNDFTTVSGTVTGTTPGIRTITPYLEYKIAPNPNYSMSTNAFSFTVTANVISTNCYASAGYSIDGGVTFTALNTSSGGTVAPTVAGSPTSYLIAPAAILVGGTASVLTFAVPASTVAATKSFILRLAIWRSSGSGAASGTAQISIGGPTVSGTSTFSITPVISVPNPTTLIGFHNTSNSASVPQSFLAEAINLTSNLVITPTTHYEVSADNMSFTAAPLNISPVSGNVSKMIYVRLKANLTAGDYNSELILLSATGTTNKTVSCSGYYSTPFYYVGTGSLKTAANWGSNSNGTGIPPADFITDRQNYVITNTAAAVVDGGTWTVTGLNSSIVLGDATQAASTLSITQAGKITGQLDVAAALNGGSNKIIITRAMSSTSNPIWGSLDPNTIIEFSGAEFTGTTDPLNLGSSLGGTLNVFNKAIKSIRVVNGAIASINGTDGNTPTITGELYVESGSVLNSGLNSNSYINIANGGSLVINGLFRTPKISGGISAVSNPTSNSAKAINFLGTENVTFGAASVFDYFANSTANDQKISPRTDYKNLLLSAPLVAIGLVSNKIFSPGVAAVSGVLTIDEGVGTTTFATLKIAGTIFSAVGALTSGTGGSIEFSGTSPQTILNSFNASAPSNLIVSNASGVSLAQAGVIPDNYNVIMAGGNLKTAGFNETVGTLNVTNNATLTLGSGVHSFNFTDSSTLVWAVDKILTIKGWSGNVNQSGTSGKVFTSSLTGLTVAQLAQIKFEGFDPGAALIGNGELVPTNVLASSNFELVDLNYYPNPTSGQITVSNSAAITAISVATILGQEVLALQPNTTFAVVNLDRLARATYFVKVSSEGKSKVFKIVKN